jgi:hypothetical protein
MLSYSLILAIAVFGLLHQPWWLAGAGSIASGGHADGAKEEFDWLFRQFSKTFKNGSYYLTKEVRVERSRASWLELWRPQPWVLAVK